MDDNMIRAAREIDAVPILPRDCDGGLVDLAAEAAGFHPDERIGIVEDDQDNTAMIARDLEEIADRVRRLSFGTYANWRVLAYICGTLKGAAGTLENLQLTCRRPDERIGIVDDDADNAAMIARDLS